ncbi:hypothetical protein K4K49_012602 [Colletotrichum sp. SAR 10_70]|nr:hypothetical protein K4K50_009713 [Colletotrichum sp. SAR 10_71]KAI8176135.1 hypothetical protein K4K51_006816 [Colletotrichum sp. SAR 10_75]KAI8189066.1 hypothetical protein K4K49_012602 [Colletotrichum sp. SAR 10_70]KAI8225927.1 hypothetical protein K4K53_006329 [Colletotrichum sp. SAR 10_77]
MPSKVEPGLPPVRYLDHGADLNWLQPWDLPNLGVAEIDSLLLDVAQIDEQTAWNTDEVQTFFDLDACATAGNASTRDQNNSIGVRGSQLCPTPDQPAPGGSLSTPASPEDWSVGGSEDTLSVEPEADSERSFDAVNGEEDPFFDYLDHIISDDTPLEVKKTLIGTIVGMWSSHLWEKAFLSDKSQDKVIPYRFNDGSRAFPPVAFYDMLLHNEANLDIKYMGRDAAIWFGKMSTDIADHFVGVIMEQYKIIKAATPSSPQQPESRKQSKRTGKASRLTDHQDPLLKAELQTPLTLAYRGIVDSADQAVALGKAYERFFRQESTSRENDPSWPTTEDRRREYIQKMHDAIVDTSCFQEKADALRKKAQLDAKHIADENNNDPGPSSKRKRGQDAPKKIPGLSHADAVYISAMDIQEGWELKLRWTGESCPKWEAYGTFADRWEQMCYNMKLKVSNKQLNNTRDIQNHAGRETIKRRKLEEEASGSVGA